MHAYITVLPQAMIDQMQGDLPGLQEVLSEIESVPRPCENCGVVGQAKKSHVDGLTPEDIPHFVCVECAEKVDPEYNQKEDLSKEFLDLTERLLKPMELQGDTKTLRESYQQIVALASGIEDDVPDNHPILVRIADTFWDSFASNHPDSARLLKPAFRDQSAKAQVLYLIAAKEEKG